MSEQAAPPPPPPPAPTASPPAQKPGGALRALAALGAIVMLFAAGIFVAAAVDIGGTPTLRECNRGEVTIPKDNTCYDGSKTKRTIQVGLMFLAALVGLASVIVGLMFVFTGRRGPLFLQLFIAAIVIGALSLALDLV